MRKLVIYTDGASKGNPGDAAIGAVITDENGNVVREISEYIGVATNNIAEYTALIVALNVAKKLGAEEVEISTDSELMVRQLTGVYKVKAPNLKPLFLKAVSLLREFSKIKITHVMREFNKRADQLANEGIKKHKQNCNIKPTQPEPQAEPQSDQSQQALDL